ncbi:MAG: hypothetical protein IKD41_04540 [Alistipes sp.]|nr:hypothetical protein [Alistipes sp.]
MDKQKSLEIISQMISDTSAQIESNSGKYFLVWGYTTIIISIFEYFVMILGLNPLFIWGWWLIPIIGGCLTLFLSKMEQMQPKSYLDRSIGAVWAVFGASSLFALIAAVAYNVSMFYMIVLLMGMGTIITGAICRHRNLTICGVVAMVLSLIFPIKHILVKNMEVHDACCCEEWIIYSDIIIFAVIFLVMMVIPGHIMYYRQTKR